MICTRRALNGWNSFPANWIRCFEFQARGRVGYDAIAGLVPGLGDAAAMLPAAWIVLESYHMGLPRHKLVRQGLNVAVDTTFGSIPLVGSVFDAWFKSNLRNVDILRSHLNRNRLAGVAAPYGNKRSP